MKKIFFICIVSLFGITFQTKAQMRDTTSNRYKVDASSLLQKSKNQKTTAWILLGAGAGLFTAGSIVLLNEVGKDLSSYSNFLNSTSSNSTAGVIMTIAGTGAMLGSIPLFIASSKNKRKANLMLKDETVLFNPQLNIKEHLISIGVKINL